MNEGGHLTGLVALALLTASDALAANEEPVGVYCRRHAGFAVGAVYAPGTWERIGKAPFFATASPIVAGACALDMGPISVALGAELQFTYVHYERNDPEKSLSTGWITVSAAVTGGTDELRAGVFLAGALVPVGFGDTKPIAAGTVTEHSLLPSFAGAASHATRDLPSICRQCRSGNRPSQPG